MEINTLINVKKMDSSENKYNLKKIAQTLYVKHRLFIMNKATSVQRYTYLGLVVSENNSPKFD